MGRYDSDIDGNPYLSEHGKYVAQFARNHGITTDEAYDNPTVKAHKEALEHLTGCFAKKEKIMHKDPLTQQELQRMAGKPVYCPEIGLYGIVKCETVGIWAGMPFLVGVWHHDGGAVKFEFNIAKRKLKCYGINEN